MTKIQGKNNIFLKIFKENSKKVTFIELYERELNKKKYREILLIFVMFFYVFYI